MRDTRTCQQGGGLDLRVNRRTLGGRRGLYRGLRSGRGPACSTDVVLPLIGATPRIFGTALSRASCSIAGAIFLKDVRTIRRRVSRPEFDLTLA